MISHGLELGERQRRRRGQRLLNQKQNEFIILSPNLAVPKVIYFV